MTPFQERILTFGPMAIVLTIAVAFTFPAYNESQTEHNEVNAKKLEYEGIMAKAADRDRLSKVRNTLQTDIDTLRKTIPRAPYLDLLMLDVEHMATDSKVDIIGLEAPEKVSSNQPETNDVEEIMKARTEAAAVATAIKPPSTVVKKEEPKANPFGIKQLTRRLYITGDYDNLIAFMRRLEAYQRIISMKNLTIAIMSDQDPNSTKTAAGDKAQKLKLNKPVMTFLLNVYYLP